MVLYKQCSLSRRIARDSLGNSKNHAHSPGQNVHSRTFFSLKIYRKSSLFIHSTASLISFILFLVFDVVFISISVIIHACNSAMPMEDRT